MTMKNMKNDGIGYISGRGLSKYWGVSKQVSLSPGPSPWVVKFADAYIPAGKADRYRLFLAQGFTLKECDAAKIASYFHDNQKPFDQHPARIEIVSVDGKKTFIVDTRKKHISIKFVLADTETTKVSPNKSTQPDFYTSPDMLSDILKSDVLAEEKVVEDKEEIAYNQGFSAGFALNEIIRSKLGTKGLKSILEAVEKRLKDK